MSDYLVNLTIENISMEVARAIVDDYYGAMMWSRIEGELTAFPDSTAVVVIGESSHDKLSRTQ